MPEGYELARVTERVVLSGQGRALYTRNYYLRNPSEADVDLALVTFTARFPQDTWEIRLREDFRESDGGEAHYAVELLPEEEGWGFRRVKWGLRKPFLAPGEAYMFVIQWEVRHLVRRTRDYYWFSYSYGENQQVPFEFTVELPTKRELLENEYLGRRRNVVYRTLLRLFWPIRYSANVDVERIEQGGHVCLRHTKTVSRNNMLDIWVLYWMELPWLVVFILGVVAALPAELLGSYVWEWLSRVLGVR